MSTIFVSFLYFRSRKWWCNLSHSSIFLLTCPWSK